MVVLVVYTCQMTITAPTVALLVAVHNLMPPAASVAMLLVLLQTLMMIHSIAIAVYIANVFNLVVYIYLYNDIYIVLQIFVQLTTLYLHADYSDSFLLRATVDAPLKCHHL